MAKTAIYLRLSLADDDDESNAIKRQRIDCLAHAKGLGIDETDIEEFVDDGISGFKKVKRPKRDELVSRIPEFDTIIIWKPDRLARNTADAVRIFEECLKHETNLVSVRGGIDLSTGMGKAMSTFGAVFAELESSNISERVINAKRYLAGQGKWSNGRCVYGYEIVDHPDGSKNKTLAPVPERAEVVRQMVKLMLEDGKTCNGVAAILNEEGTMTPSGSTWTSRTIMQVLTSRTMLGHMLRDGKPVIDDDGMPLVCWEPILTAAEFREVARLIDSMKRTKARVGGMAATSPLRGAVFCNDCGKQMSLQGKGGKNKPVYRCSAPCAQQISQANLERVAVSEVRLFADQHPAVVLPSQAELVDTSEVEQALDDVMQQMVEGIITTKRFGEASRKLETKKQAMLDAAGPATEARSLDLGEVWWNFTPEEKAAQVRDLCKVHVRRESPRVRMEWLAETPQFIIFDEDGTHTAETGDVWRDEPAMDFSNELMSETTTVDSASGAISIIQAFEPGEEPAVKVYEVGDFEVVAGPDGIYFEVSEKVDD
jgi:DNA invertase Pin-like site-specific DNA recombinase